MARWRSEAIDRLPELRQVIGAAQNIMALWIELQQVFEEAYDREPRDDSTIERIYSYADWCEQAPRNDDAGHDPLTAVMVAFYEHIPACSPARQDMPRWFRYQEVVQNKEVFAYHIGEEEYNHLLEYMGKNRNLYQPRRRRSKP